MPIDPRMVKWDEAPTNAPTIDPRMVKWEDVPQDKPRGFWRLWAMWLQALCAAPGQSVLPAAPIDVASGCAGRKGLTLESTGSAGQTWMPRWAPWARIPTPSPTKWAR